MDTASYIFNSKKTADSLFETDSAGSGMKLLMDVLDLAERFGNDSLLGYAHYYLGHAHYRYGNIIPSLGELEQAAAFFGRSGLREQVAKTENLIGNIQLSFRNFDEALRFYNNCFRYWTSVKNNKMISTIQNNLGLTYIETGDTARASFEFFSSLAIRLELGDSTLIGQTYNNIGSLRFKMGQYAQALEYYKKGLHYRNAVSCPNAARLESMINIGKTLHKLGRIVEAELYLKQAMDGAGKESRHELIRRATAVLKDIYYQSGRYADAYRMQEQYYAYTDSIFSIQKREETFRHGVQYEYKRKMLEDSLRNAEEKKRESLERQKEDEIRSEKDKRNLVLFIALGTGLLLCGLFVFVLAKRNREKLITNRIIYSQKAELETRQKEIQDSIRYARRIQEALLPSEKEIKESFPSSFILYRPKDIISGDFYWAETTGDRTWIALGDCTGHGVPGAMMSMLGISFLNEALREKGDKGPARMLDELHRKVVSSLNRGVAGRDQLSDGMDIALLCIDRTRRTVVFSLASRPLLIVSAGEKKLVKGERYSIGGIKDEQSEPFRQVMLSLRPGDSLFLYSDGFADQFGGKDGKKFKSRVLEDTLLNLASLDPNGQFKILERTFDTWKGSYEQVDDVSVIGIKIN